MIALWPILSRIWPYLAGVALLLGAMWFLDQRGYARAKADQARADAAMTAKLGAVVALIDRKTADRIAAIDATERTVNTTLIREVQSNARYSDPAGLSAGIVRELNTARAASCPTGVDCGPVPATAPTD